MNEISLSENLNQIELEINYHKEKAGEAIWEIGRRLNHVKENDLAHGEFMDWCKDKINLTSAQANKYMKIASEFSNLNSSLNLGVNALYLISTLPDEQKQEEIKKAEEGNPSTSRELQELKRQIKQKETQITLKEKRIQSLKEENANLEFKANQPKEVVKEVKPHDYDGLKSDNQQLSKALKEQQEENQKMRNQINQWQTEQGELDKKSKRYDELSQAIQEMEGRMDTQQKRIAAVKDITSKLKAGNQLIDELSGLIYLADYEEVSRNDFLSAEINKLLHRLNIFTHDLSKRLDSSTILEGEIINE